MIFHKEKKLCMFLPPKTGTQTARIFLKNVGWNIVAPEHQVPESCLVKYPNLIEYKSYVYLRNPLDRFVSGILFLKQNTASRYFKQLLESRSIDVSVEHITYEQFLDVFEETNNKFANIFNPQTFWMTHPNTEVLDFDNYEAEIRRISGDYTNPVIIKNKSTDFGRSVVTQKVIDFVRQHYAADYALAKDRLGKEY